MEGVGLRDDARVGFRMKLFGILGPVSMCYRDHSMVRPRYGFWIPNIFVKSHDDILST